MRKHGSSIGIGGAVEAGENSLIDARIMCAARFVGSHPSVLSRKFIEEIGRENADPSTPFGAKNAPNYAQDDSIFV